MPKPILSQSNIDKLTTDLYALSNSALILEADAVAADFPTWLNDKFDLTADQYAYVSDFPPIVKKFYGSLFATGFSSRGPIIFPAIPNNPAPRRIKETRANLFGAVNYNDQDMQLDGTLDITIEFTLL